MLTFAEKISMPLERLVHEGTRTWALWSITESEHTLATALAEGQSIPPTIHNTQKRLEWFAGRILTQRLLEKRALPFMGISKDVHGKPSLTGYPFHLSLSHSYPFVAAILDEEHPVGIDLEQPKAKLIHVAPRVLAADELTDAGSTLVKHCVYWCAKETLIKIHGKKDLVLAENLHVGAFDLEQSGLIIGRIIVNHQQSMIPLYYRVFPEFVLVFSTPDRIGP